MKRVPNVQLKVYYLFVNTFYENNIIGKWQTFEFEPKLEADFTRLEDPFKWNRAQEIETIVQNFNKPLPDREETKNLVLKQRDLGNKIVSKLRSIEESASLFMRPLSSLFND